jgi:tetratricopeptide (TPR) repeat protein
MGVAFTHDDRHAEAAQAYRAAIAIDSTNASAWNDLGWSLAKLGFFGEAIPAFRSALRHEPQLELAANNLAWAMDQASSARFQEAFALQQTGHPADAVPIYRELLAAFPKWTNAHYNLGHSLMALGRHAEAIAEFRAALALDPGLHAVHLHLATCLEAVGAADEAQRERDLYERSQATSEDHSPRRPS